MAVLQPSESREMNIGPISLGDDQPITFFLNTRHGQWLKWEVEKEGSFTLPSFDESKRSLTYKVIKMPDHAQFNEESRQFTWKPTKDDIQVDVHIVEFEVANESVTTVEQVMITVGKKEKMGNILSRYQHAHELARMVADKRTTLPLAVGVYNSPGEGKTFLLDLIEDKLKVINKSKDKLIRSQCVQTHAVRFDASEYKDQEKIWFSLLKQLFSKYEEEMGSSVRWKYRRFTFKKLWKKNQKTFFMSLSLIILLTLLAFFVMSLPSVQQTTGNWQTPLGIFISVAAVLGATAPLVKDILVPTIKKTNTLFIKPMTDELIEKLKYPNYKNRLGTREEVKESLADLMKLWIQDSHDRIVVMVDHLDYCNEETIQEFFDSLYLFLSNKSYEPISFIIPLNKEAVCLALANKHSYCLADAKATRKMKIAFGKGYLESYITLPYKMPKITGYDQLIDDLLPDLSTKGELAELLRKKEDNFLFMKEDRDILKEIIAQMSHFQTITPVDIKKIINLLIFSKEKWKSITSMKKSSNFDKYKYFSLLVFRKEFIIWFLFEYFYPSEAAKFAHKLDAIRNQKDYVYTELKTIRGEVYTSSSISNSELNIFFSELDSVKMNGHACEYIISSHQISLDLLAR